MNSRPLRSNISRVIAIVMLVSLALACRRPVSSPWDQAQLTRRAPVEIGSGYPNVRPLIRRPPDLPVLHQGHAKEVAESLEALLRWMKQVPRHCLKTWLEWPVPSEHGSISNQRWIQAAQGMCEGIPHWTGSATDLPHVEITLPRVTLRPPLLSTQVLRKWFGRPFDTRWIRVDVTVGPDGVPTRATSRPGHELNADNRFAVDHAMQWRFVPTLINGVPQYDQVFIWVGFRWRMFRTEPEAISFMEEPQACGCERFIPQ